MGQAPTRILSSVGALAFIVLATANAAGYRYGTSDQAFYIPAFIRAIDPSTFPRDAALIDAQARLMVLDEAVAAVVEASGLSIQAVCAIGYFVSLLVIWTALMHIGAALYLTPWGTVALAAAFTLRHQITRTSTNTFEPYFHPRMLAFGVGALALAAILRQRPWLAIGLVALAGVIHVTTALWFAVLLGVALIVADRRLRPPLLAVAVVGAVTAVWVVTAGPLVGSMAAVDPAWRQLLETKDTLFAHEWPASAWVANIGSAAVWAWACAERRRRGLATPTDAGLLAGGAALLAVFLATLPLSAAGMWLVVEFQLSRVFWLIDFLATVYLISAIEIRWPRHRAIQAVAGLLIVFSVARGVYILYVEHPERSLFAFDAPATPWIDAMQWLARTPVDTHVLADPGHAWKYGTSVRVSAARDVFHEEVKDTAVAIYSREVAMRVIERSRVIGPFSQLTEAHARTLAQRYGLDYLVTEGRLDLPVAHRNGQFTIYRLH